MALHHCSARATKFLVNFLSGQANFSPGPPGRPVVASVFWACRLFFGVGGWCGGVWAVLLAFGWMFFCPRLILKPTILGLSYLNFEILLVSAKAYSMADEP